MNNGLKKYWAAVRAGAIPRPTVSRQPGVWKHRLYVRVPHGVNPRMEATLTSDGILTLRERGRRKTMEFNVGTLYVNAIRREALRR